MRAPYILYKRTAGKKQPTYYVAFWSSAHGDYRDRQSVARIIEALGERGRGISPTSRAGADKAVQMWLESGAPQRRGETWWSYLSEFWGRDGEYAAMLRDAGRSISNAYADDNEDVLTKYVEPYLQEKGRLSLTLSQVDAAFIEAMLRAFRGQHELSGRRLNQIRQAIGVAMKEAKRLGKIARNPVLDVMKFDERSQARQIFTRAEAARFFAELSNEDPRVQVIHLLGTTTGMRLGECLGLTIDRLKEETVDTDSGPHVYYWIELGDERSNWTETDGHHGAKSGSVGEVPVPERTAEALKWLHGQNPWRNGWVFYSTRKHRPMSARPVWEEYNRVCREIGISDEERKARKLGFHAWRHFWASFVAPHISSQKVQRTLRHASEGTTKIYTHLTDEERREIAAVAGGLIDSPGAGSGTTAPG